MAIAGPRGYPGSKGLTGNPGTMGGTGATGQGVTVTDNGNGTYTIVGANGVVTVSDGKTPIEGIDYFTGNTGDYISYVFTKVLIGAAVPTITSGSGTYDGITEVMPSGSSVWVTSPTSQEGYTVYVSINRYAHDLTSGGLGTWSLVTPNWSVPTIYSESATIQNQLVSYAFTRDVTQPSPPTGGSYVSPTPTTAGWTDGIPPGTVPVYISKRLFTSDGLTPQDATWSTPGILGGAGSGSKLQFGPTNLGPWNDTPNETDEWMISCTQDVSGVWDCDTDNPVRIKGETGDTTQSTFKAFAFKRSVAILNELPTGGDFNSPIPVDDIVTGWTDFIPPGDADLYVSNRLFSTDGEFPQAEFWSASQLFSGQGATVFSITASSQIFAYDTDGLNPSPSQIVFSAFRQNIPDAPDWTTDPVITIAANATATDTFTITAAEFGALTSIKVLANTGQFEDETTIIKVSDGAVGVTGLDGEIREVRFEYTNDTGSDAPDTGNWHAILAETDEWMREGTFYDNVLQGSWSVGTKIVGNDGANTFTEFYFADVSATGTPDSHPLIWSTVQGSEDVFVISRTTTLGVVGPWSSIVNIRGDDGVSGKFFETRFAVSPQDTAPIHDATSPVFPNYDKTLAIPAGWVTDPNLATTDDEVIWAITATKNFDGTLDIDWTTTAAQWGAYTPRRGTDYNDGTGVYQSKIYIEAADGFNTPPTVNTGSWDGTTEVVPSGWSDDPMSPSVGNFIYESTYLYVATLVNGVSTWPTNAGTWSTPSKYAYIPTLGTDYFNGTDGNGSFQSYIFRNTTLGTTPTTPTGGSYNGTTEVFPSSWTDSPITPAGDELTWVSQRLYTSIDDVWQTPPNWSTPSAFSALTALTGTLTNSSATIASDSNGQNIIFTGEEGGDFLVFFGADSAISGTTFTIAGGTNNGSFHQKIQSSLTLSINKSTGVYTVFGSSWSSNKETFTIVATHTASGAITTKTYTAVKSKDGAIGESGTANRLDIAYGTTSTGGSVDYPPNASATGKTYIGTNVVTWIPPVTEPNVSTNNNDYEWSQIVGTDGDNGLSSRIDFAYSNSINGSGNGVGNVQYATLGNPATPQIGNLYLGTNAVTWVTGTTEPNPSTTTSDYEWSRYVGEDGTSGADSIGIVLSNPSHTIPTDISGNGGNYTNSGTLISVYEGANKLDYNGSGTTPGTWRVNAVGTDITPGTITAVVLDAAAAQASGFTGGTGTMTAKIVFTCIGESANGTPFTIEIQQSFNKNLAAGSGDTSITSSVLGPIASTVLTHSSIGNNISVSWGYTFGDTGTNPPNTTTIVQLLKDNVVFDTDTFDTQIIDLEPGSEFWEFTKTVSIKADNVGNNDVDYKLNIINAGSFDTPTTDRAFILATEAL